MLTTAPQFATYDVATYTDLDRALIALDAMWAESLIGPCDHAGIERRETRRGVRYVITTREHF